MQRESIAMVLGGQYPRRQRHSLSYWDINEKDATIGPTNMRAMSILRSRARVAWRHALAQLLAINSITATVVDATEPNATACMIPVVSNNK